ncbi:filamentous hemagglutinin N-terminal domain-containing protein, partial [Microcoleus sp. N3A4]|uniref:two-partner secretion domain-containing protein n=1 Tax=Microcoleus sp. N3A4 TaxID=3055379 RepID=UPI002FD2D4FC
MTANRLHLLGWLFIVGWLSAAAGSANAQPIAPAPDGTNTVVTPSGNRYDISGGSFSGDRANLFHSFTQFGLSEGQTANFLTNPSIQNILGRITGGNASLINGLIQVTGGNSNLFLMNPAGIIFGPNASLNVPGSFNATTATGIGFGNNQWFSAIGNNNWATLIGTPNSFAFANFPGGSIVNAGNLTVAPGQSLTLVGGTVVNTGQLTAPSGSILISAVPGNNLVRISQAGNLLSLDIQPTATQSSLPNNWTQPVLSLPELLTGKGAAQATGLTVNPNGEVVLTGNVAVPVTGGTAIASGTLNVSGNTGGNVNILGDKVGVIAGKIDASGVNGAGNVLIGGDYQGLGTVPNAARTFVSSDSTINADAVSNGNGGRVIVWADETTRFNGNITARGGLFSGNGGFVEVSGKQSLDFQGLVDLRSTFGIAGTLLLDPTDITISTGGDTVGDSFSAGGVFTPSGATSTINNGTLQTQLGLSNVTISTASGFASLGDITVSAPVAWNNSNSLTLQANNNITVNQPISNQGNGAIALNASNAISVNANLTTNGGNITLTSTNDINTSLGKINSQSTSGGNGGAIALSTAGGNINTGDFLSNSNAAGTGGDITLSVTAGTGAIDTTAGSVESSSPLGTGGAIALSTAGGKIDTGFMISGGQSGGKITLSVTGGTGAIDTTAGTLYSTSQSGNGGAIALSTAGGNITTGVVGSLSSGAGTGGKITLSVTGGTGAIDTSNSYLNSASQSGNGGAIALSTAGGNITADLNSASQSGNGGAIAVSTTGGSISASLNSASSGAGTGGNITLSTGGIGAIDTTGKLLNSSSESGNGGAISLTAPGGITTGGINSSTNSTASSSTAGTITFNPSTSNITLSGNINASAQTGSGNSISFPTKVILTQSITNITTSGTAKSGEITFGGTVDGTIYGNNQLNITTGTVNFNGPVGGTTPLAALAVDANTNITSTGAISITTTGDISTGDITNSGRAIALTSNNGNIDTSAGAIDTTSSTGNGGPITLSANNINASNLNSSSTAGNGGNITLTGKTGNIFAYSGVVNSSSSSGAGGDIAIATPNQVGINGIDGNGLPGTGNISISGNEIGFSGTDSVQGKGTFSIAPFSPNVGIRFQTGLGDDPQAIDVGTPFLSSLRNGFSAIVFGGNTTTGNITVENLPVSFADPVTFNTQGTIFVNPNQSISGTDNASITLNATTNNLNGNITTQSQDITINGNILVGDSVLVSNGNSAGGNILFNNNIDGSGNLTLETGTVNFSVKSAIGNTTPLGNITVKSAGTATFNAVTATSFTTNVGGTTTLNGNVKTIGPQTYGDAVTIAKNPTLTGNG